VEEYDFDKIDRWILGMMEILYSISHKNP